MKCYKCGREKVSEEIEGTMGVKVVYCCNVYHIEIASLRPKAKQAIISKDEYIFDLILACLSGSEN